MKTKYLNILKIFVFIVICFVSLGYAAFGSELSISNIVADVRVASDIRITSVEQSNSTGSATSSSVDYDVDSVVGGVALPNNSSSITYKIGITNFGNTEMGIYSISGLPSNLTYEISDYKLHDKICDSTGGCSLGITKLITLTIKYKDEGFNSSSTEYNLKIDFDFRKMHTVTYEGITNNNYPTTVIDGGNLTFTATSNIPPKIVAFSNGNRVSYDLYSYENNKFTYNNVTSDITLKYKEKAYLRGLSSGTLFKEDEYRTKIDSVYFVDYVDTKNAVKTWDLTSSADESNSIMGWVTSENDLYIGSEWNIYAKQLTEAFRNMTNVKVISFGNLNTSETTTMYYMFNGCSSLTSLDVSSFNTSNVTNMGRMFQGLSKLNSLDVSNFNTSKVTDMHGMFYGMKSIIELDVSNFNTSNVTKMDGMFQDCLLLESLDLRKFNTSKVTSMSAMFASTQSLIELNLSSFNTSNVTNMMSMFSSCGVKKLDLSNFDTSKVDKMDYMFNYSKITDLNIDGFNTSNVTSMVSMFAGVRASQLDVSSFETSNVTNMRGMFKDNFELTELDISKFNTSNVENMNEMFMGNYKLEILKMNNATFDRVTTYTDMFTSIKGTVNITTKNETTKAWLENALGEGIGTVTIAS